VDRVVGLESGFRPAANRLASASGRPGARIPVATVSALDE